MEDSEFKHESLQDRQTIVRYLHALSEGFANGSIKLGQEEEQIILVPNGLLKLDVKAKQKDERCKLTLKISWKENGNGEKSATGRLVISAREKG